MKLELELELDFDSSETVEEVVFIAMLKKELRESKEALTNAWHIDDIKQHKKLIKACKVLLEYYGQ